MIVAEGNLVMVYGPASGTNTGSFFGQPPTGKHADWTGIAIYRFNDDGHDRRALAGIRRR